MDNEGGGAFKSLNVILAFAVVLGCAVVFWKLQKSQEVKVEIVAAPTVSEERPNEQVVVEVVGAVIEPGVLVLDANSRIDQALVAAGGLSATADRDWIEKYINRAQLVSDGMKIYIPKKGEMEKIADLGVSTEVSVLGERKVNVNTASLSMLEDLWGVGEVTAKKIVELRPYKSIEELLEKKAVNKNVFDKIKDEISVY